MPLSHVRPYIYYKLVFILKYKVLYFFLYYILAFSFSLLLLPFF